MTAPMAWDRIRRQGTMPTSWGKFCSRGFIRWTSLSSTRKGMRPRSSYISWKQSTLGASQRIPKNCNMKENAMKLALFTTSFTWSLSKKGSVNVGKSFQMTWTNRVTLHSLFRSRVIEVCLLYAKRLWALKSKRKCLLGFHIADLFMRLLPTLIRFNISLLILSNKVM